MKSFKHNQPFDPDYLDGLIYKFSSKKYEEF